MICDQADLYKDPNGLCYNYTMIANNFVNIPVGWWDIKKRLDYKKPVIPAEDYYKFA
jgi:hypothetical protein